jgi:hypothetical protein
MLSEIFQYLMTPCPKYVSSMGYLHGAIAIEARYKRCVAAWQNHVNSSKSLIKQAANQCQKKSLVVVLGSGILSDIPLTDLSKGFDQVELVDLVHLGNARKTAKTYGNVGVTGHDITGAAEPLFIHVLTGGMGPIPVPSATFPLLEEADLVISASVLSQLPLCLLETARNGLDWKEADLVDFARGILQTHLTTLEKLSGTVCLITEVEREHYEESQIKETEDPLFGLDIGPGDQEWLWDIAPPPELDPRRGLRNKMIGRIRSS